MRNIDNIEKADNLQFKTYLPSLNSITLSFNTADQADQDLADLKQNMQEQVKILREQEGLIAALRLGRTKEGSIRIAPGCLVLTPSTAFILSLFICTHFRYGHPIGRYFSIPDNAFLIDARALEIPAHSIVLSRLQETLSIQLTQKFNPTAYTPLGQKVYLLDAIQTPAWIEALKPATNVAGLLKILSDKNNSIIPDFPANFDTTIKEMLG
jgi:hypothetical protein